MTRRILFVLNHAGFFLSHRLPLAIAAQRLGYDVHVATPQSKHVPRVLAAGLQWHPILLARSSKNPWTEVATLWSLSQLYRALRPDLVHHATSKPVLYGTPIARHTRVPAVVNAISGMGHVFADDGPRPAVVRSAVAVGYRFALRHPHMRVIFQNEEHQAAFVASGWARPAECILIPGFGVDTSLFIPAAVGTPVRELPNVIFASRIVPPRISWTAG